MLRVFLIDTCWQSGGNTFWWAVRFIEKKLPTVVTTSPGGTITVLTLTSVDLHHYLTCEAEERVCCCPLSPGGVIVAALLCTSSFGGFLCSRRSASFECPWMTSPTHKCQKERHCVARTLWMFGSSLCRSDDGVIACANILCSDIILPRFTWEGVSRSFLVKGNSSLRQTQYGTFAETPSHSPWTTESS